jgi:arylsulfatase A
MNRRGFLSTLGAVPLAAPLLGARRPPNIVILLADDLGYGDLGFTGCPDVKTPNLDRLAAQSANFTHAYCNGPVCTPTRTALLTGKYQQRSGMDNVIYVNQRELGLDTNASLLPQTLKSAGYATGIVGKWHLGFQPKYFPTRRGFDEFKGFLSGNIDYFAHVDRMRNPDLWDGEQPLTDPRYMTDFIAEESMAFLDRHAKSSPAFLYVAFNAVHDPFQGPGDRALAGNFEESDTKNRTRAVMVNMIQSLDSSAGRILDHLKKTHLEQNTVVFFLSDNGGVPGVGRNLPFRGNKGQLWEGGIRTPLLARWPGHFKPGTKCSDPVAAFDLFPTCAEIAGSRPPGKLDGVSLLQACYGRKPVERESGIYFHYNKQHAFVRNNKMKYLRDEQGADRLFDLASDPGETRDLAAERPGDVAALREDYRRWMLDVHNGTMPTETDPPKPVRRGGTTPGGRG